MAYSVLIGKNAPMFRAACKCTKASAEKLASSLRRRAFGKRVSVRKVKSCGRAASGQHGRKCQR